MKARRRDITPSGSDPEHQGRADRARHVAFHRHSFPKAAQSRILVDVGHVLFGTGMNWTSAKPIGGEVHVDPATGEVSGFMVYRGARSETRMWKVYFAARFDTAFDSFGTWNHRAELIDGSRQGRGN